MNPLIALLTISLLPVMAGAQDAQPETKSNLKVRELKRISAAEAKYHIDESLIVAGKIAQVSIRPELVYVNLDDKYPQTSFSGVIFARAANQSGDLSKLEGKRVEIKGKIEEYREKPQIVLNSTSQLRVIEKSSEKAQEKQTWPRIRTTR